MSEGEGKLLNLNKFAIIASNVVWDDDLRRRTAELYTAGKSQSKIAEEISKHIGVEITTSAIASALRRIKRDGLVKPREKKLKTITIGRSNIPNRGVVVRRRPHPKPKATGASLVRSLEQNMQLAKEARKNYGRHSESFDPSRECGLLDLTHDTCRWPLGMIDAEPPYRFCGCPPRKPSVYCAGHLAASVDISRGGFKRVYEDA